MSYSIVSSDLMKNNRFSFTIFKPEELLDNVEDAKFYYLSQICTAVDYKFKTKIGDQIEVEFLETVDRKTLNLLTQLEDVMYCEFHAYDNHGNVIMKMAHKLLVASVEMRCSFNVSEDNPTKFVLHGILKDIKG